MAGTVIHGVPTAAPIPGLQIGVGADKVVVSPDGVISYEGTAKRKLTMRPRVNMGLSQTSPNRFR